MSNTFQELKAKTSNYNGPGTNFLELLTLLFIGLKLTGFISWSWLWVLSPLWIPVVLAIVIALIIFVFIVIAESRK